MRDLREDPLLSAPFDLPLGRDRGRRHRGWLGVVMPVVLVAGSASERRGGEVDRGREGEGRER